jgi:ATP-binding cassette subfamily B protein
MERQLSTRVLSALSRIARSKARQAMPPDAQPILSALKRLVVDNGREYAPLYLAAVLSMLLVAGATAASAYLMKDVVNSIFVDQSRSALYWLTLSIVIIFFAKGLASYVSEVLIGSIGNRLVAQTQRRMFDHLLSADVSLFQALPSADIIMRLTVSANSARDMLNMVSLTFGRDLFTLCGLIITMVVLDPVMAAIAVLGGPIAIVASQSLVKRIQKAARSEAHSMTGVINSARELVQGVRVVKSFQLEQQLRRRMVQSIDAVQRMSNRMMRIEASVNPLVDTLGGITVAAVVFYAGWRSINFGDTPGQFFAFVTALLMAADPARRLSRAHIRLASSAIGVKMMYELLDRPAVEARDDDLPSLRLTAGEVVFNNVNFSYGPHKRAVDRMSMRIAPGKTAALVGLSGAGKSTVAALLLRFRDPESGTITIDGQNISDYSRHSVRSQTTMVEQEAFLFEGTILENIRAGRPDATFEQCVDAAKISCAHEFIQEMPNGYETQVGELGSQVSGGQRQRIALARAFLKDAPIIILDEPTSALDGETESLIQAKLLELTRGKTTIVIAHRLSTIMRADTIHVVHAGQVVESGAHEELLERQGQYWRLFKHQWAGFAGNAQATLS